MTIAILPARLANQIAAGEVVERPASVIKELVENSLDAGATTINIEVDKGGVKRIRISDNGIGIAKDELTLALSRHATSKIKDLKDLEAINSLGFRGEALASISSVARLTLTSKPKNQATAWQAIAEGRDMAVTVKPAAHPDGTSIEVLDLFFNTPARRKFLRTDKTEFNHLDEVIRRIALARFDVNFSLSHNGKMIRQYRAVATKAQNAKRVAMVCGQQFVDNAIEVNCQHDDMVFSGWLAKPSFARKQNDLCYSYVNGRMMRDKLINHAIRQAYADLLPADTHPAFVLFLVLDHAEVDVNVHPAKHEVRFHQSRYVHDFIYSVCHNALMADKQELTYADDEPAQATSINQTEAPLENVSYQRPDYVKPLQQINETRPQAGAAGKGYSASPAITKAAVDNYRNLMTVASNEKIAASPLITSPLVDDEPANSADFFLAVEQEGYGVFKQGDRLHLLSLFTLASQVAAVKISQSWQSTAVKVNNGLISQPLLLPVVLTLSEQQITSAQNFQTQLALAGIIFTVAAGAKKQIQIRQFPALLREQASRASFITIINEFLPFNDSEVVGDSGLITAISKAMTQPSYSAEQAQILWQSAKKSLSAQKIKSILLNSLPVDLTSLVKQLKSITFK